MTVRVNAIALLTIVSALVLRCASANESGVDFFEKKIRPALVQHCYECHSAADAQPKGGLRLDSREAARKGGETGPAVVPNDLENSALLSAIRYESLEMPPQKQLPQTVIDDFVKWIEFGAPDPRSESADPTKVSQELWAARYEQRRQWWSLLPVTDSELPAVQRHDWSDQPIDRFLLSKLEEHNLSPTPRADDTTLLRRLTYVLTGLPPTRAQIVTYQRDLNDDRQSAYEKLVDRLLSSPHFGEHWARHWMDVVRYTDTYGYEWDIPAKGAWRYRDYLIRALNADVPFDQLVREQIAGDLLEEPRVDRDEQINESIIGTMFFQMGEKRHGDSSEFNGIHQEMLDNKIDAFSKAFQAMTISCARCHDHKLDAVAQSEYYALAGVFMSSRWITNTADLPDRNKQVFDELKQLKVELRPLLARRWLDELGKVNVDDWQRLAGKQEKIPPLESALHLWKQLENATDISSAWKEIVAGYEKEMQKRKHENAAHFKLAVDFRDGIPDGWSVDGVGLNDIVRPGDFTVALTGDSVVGRLLPGGLFTASLSPRLNGALRSPYLSQFENGHISFEAFGGEFASYRTVIDNAFLTEKQIYLKQQDPKGVLLSTYRTNQKHRVYIEFATKTSNPNFPPRVGLGGKCDEQQVADPRSWFGVTRVFLHEAPLTPADELDRFTNLFAGDAPVDKDQASRRFVDWFTSSLQAWANDRATPDDVKLINWLLDQKLITNQSESQPAIAELVTRYRDVEQRIRVPWTVNGMADLESGYDYRLNIRGDYDQLGDAVPRGYLRCVAEIVRGGQSESATPPDRRMSEGQTNDVSSLDNGSEFYNSPSTLDGSGRRELAALIASPDNPLTARVFVNRVWQHLFGHGLVRTPNDFGHLGQRPSHPALLDYLTTRFVADGWSTKTLVRSMVTTEAWQQSSNVELGATTATTIDPENRLLHHYPLRRLEAESIRDAMLASSGRLDPTLFGPPTNPFRANEDPQKRLFSGPLDGNGRRSLYTKITIMEPPRFLTLFNQPKPKISTGTRDVSSTPAQSLALLNDPFVIDQAEHWAKRLVDRDGDSTTIRLADMFITALGREPTSRETDRWQTAVVDMATVHSVSPNDILGSVPVWRDVAHSLFNMREFIYIR